ncbi:MAG: glutathione S-transferase [Pseudomonadota bacterium]
MNTKKDAVKKDAINEVCPWSGNPVSDDSLTNYNGHVVGFCNPGCRDKFERAIAHFDKSIEENQSSLDV